MRRVLLKYKYYFFIASIVFLNFIANYKSGAYLLGWDSLVTELNPWLGVKRAIFAIWEEYQSFGLLSGMAHATDLIRSIFVFFLSKLLPTQGVRYIYHLLMLLLGSFGMFKLLNFLDIQEKASFVGALFYILNLGTVQIFYFPFEPYSFFFAFLPWGVFGFLNLITRKVLRKRNLVLFLLINLLGTPSFYTQQLFVVYIIVLFSFAFGVWLKNRRGVKRLFFVFLLIFIVNSFWILPQIYFLKTSVNVVYEAKINQLATEDVYYQNKEKGVISDFLKFEGFYFDFLRKDGKYAFAFWKAHFRKFFLLQYLFAALLLIGLLTAFQRKEYGFLICFFIIATAFLNSTLPFSLVDYIIRKNGFINQIFRSPFTKFIIPYSLVASYFFAGGVSFIIDLLERYKFKILQKVLFIVVIALLFLYSLPAFRGYYFSPEMKVKIPKDYFEVIEFFKNQDKNKRIALLPEYTFWGWFFTRWGYNGSGFLWYGIEQPIVSRTFDVWSEKSESYFWEVKKILEAEDLHGFEKLLEKYDINYLILDKSLLPVVSTIKSLQYDRLIELISKSKKIIPIKDRENISLYKVSLGKPIKNFVYVVKNLPSIGPKVKLTNEDNAYLEYGDYFTPQTYQPSIYFPFLDLTTQTRLPQKNWKIREEKDRFVVTARLGIDPQNYSLQSLTGDYKYYLYKRGKVVSFPVEYKTKVLDRSLRVNVKKKLIESVDVVSAKVTRCFNEKGEVMGKVENGSLLVESRGGAVACFGYNVPYLEGRYGYLIKVKTKNLKGRRLFFYVFDDTKEQTYLEERLRKDTEIFIIPPRFKYGRGYSFVLHNNSYENISSVNKVVSLEIYAFPYTVFKKIKFVKKNLNLSSVEYLNDFSVDKKQYFLYKVVVDNLGKEEDFKNLTVVLSQAFHPGWKAFLIQNSKLKVKNWVNTYFPFLFGRELEEHVLVNNWANGWKIDNLKLKVKSEKFEIVIIFWPQYLEFLGFGLLILAFLFIAKLKSF